MAGSAQPPAPVASLFGAEGLSGAWQEVVLRLAELKMSAQDALMVESVFQSQSLLWFDLARATANIIGRMPAVGRKAVEWYI